MRFDVPVPTKLRQTVEAAVGECQSPMMVGGHCSDLVDGVSNLQFFLQWLGCSSYVNTRTEGIVSVFFLISETAMKGVDGIWI